MIFESYESYKDSGIKWLGDIPSEWEIKRVKDYTKTFSGTTPKSGDSYYYDNGETYWIRTTDLNNNELFDAEYKITKRAFEDYSLRLLPLNSVLVAMYGGIGTIGKNSIIKTKATLNQSVCAIVSNEYRFHSKFLLYFMQYFRYKWILFADSARKDPNINQDAIKNLFTIFPSLKTQQNIATYLDNQTQKIDKEIELLEKKIKQYKELKQTLINETVLRGLDKNVELKDSGVEWIGEIPKHWSSERIGIAFNERSKKVSDKDYPPLSVTKKGIVPQLENVAKTKHNDNRKMVLKGDYVINSRSDRRGSSGIALKDGSVSVINIVLEPTRNFYGKFLHHLFRSYAFKEEFYRNGRGIVYDLWTTKYSLMKAITFAFPLEEEQKKIANYLDQKTTQIDQIIKTIETKIELQKEFKKTLINDVVTGKVKV